METGGLVQSMWADAFGDEVESTITPDRAGPVHRPRPQRRLQRAAGPRLQPASIPTSSGSGGRRRRPARSASSPSTSAAFYDDVIEEALQIIKSNPDPAARKEAAETINRRFGEQVYQWWWSWTLWGIATQPYVNGIEPNTLPDGTKGIGLAFAGRHQINQIWCDDGRCE